MDEGNIVGIYMQTKLWSKEFIAVMGCTLCMAWSFYALMPTLPIYLMETMKMSARSSGLVLAAFSITAILIRPLSGYLLDNYRRSTVLTVSVLALTIAYGLYPLMGGVFAMLILRLYHGAMWGLCTSGAATVAADLVPPSLMGRGIGIYALAIPIGMTIGPMFGLELLKSQGPDRAFLAVLGVSLLSLAGAFYAKTPFTPRAGKKFSLAGMFHRKALPLSACMFFIMSVYGAIVVFIGVYADQKGFPNVSAFFFCFSATTFLSRLIAGRSFDRGHLSQMIILGLVFTATGTLWLGYAGSPLQFLLAGMASGFGFGTLMPTCQAAINTMVGSGERGAVNATYLISYDLGAGAGVFVIGLASDTFPLGEIYRYAVYPIALSAILFIFHGIPHYRRNRQHGPSVS